MNLKMTREVTKTTSEKLVPFKFKAFACYPGKSLNGYTFTKEALEQAAAKYNEKPFMLDHNYECDKVTGIISNCRYGVDVTRMGVQKEGLWVDGVGLMPETLWDKVHGTQNTPPLFKGVSVGGMAEIDWEQEGAPILAFDPDELSMTPFPAMQEAELTNLQRIHDHYVNGGEKSKMPEQIKEQKQLATVTVAQPNVHVTTSVTEQKIAEVSPPKTVVVETDAEKELKEKIAKLEEENKAFKEKAAKPEKPKVVETKTQVYSNVEAKPTQLSSNDIVTQAREAVKQADGNPQKAYALMIPKVMEPYAQ